MLDVTDKAGSPYWKILLFSIFVLFGLIIIRIWVLEIAVNQGFVSTIQDVISNQLTFADGDADLIIAKQNFIVFAMRRLVEMLMGVLILYNIIYIFKHERQTI